jgi:chromosome segregation ATPase
MENPLWQLSRSIWDGFDKAGPLSNAVTIATGAIGAGVLVLSWLGKKLKTQESQIKGLKKDVEWRDAEIAKKDHEWKDLSKRFEQIQEQLPQTALNGVERELLCEQFRSRESHCDELAGIPRCIGLEIVSFKS